MIHDEYGLDQMLFYELLEEQVQDIALGMTLFVVHTLLVCQLLRSSGIGNLVEVNACIFLDSIYHGQSLKRLAQVDGLFCIRDHGSTAYFLCHIAEHVLSQIHHSVIVGVCLVQLHQCEFRIVSGVQTFVTEYTADLEDTLHAADDQSLQVQLQGDTQLHVLIQRIVMGLERSCCRTAGIGYQHGGLYFQEALSVQITTDGADDLRTLYESILNILIHDQVGITLTITDIGIGQAMELLRQDL